MSKVHPVLENKNEDKKDEKRWPLLFINKQKKEETRFAERVALA